MAWKNTLFPRACVGGGGQLNGAPFPRAKLARQLRCAALSERYRGLRPPHHARR
jgi:hypothetical protein